MVAVAPVAHDKVMGHDNERNPLAQDRKLPEDASSESCESSCQVSGSVTRAGRSARPQVERREALQKKALIGCQQ